MIFYRKEILLHSDVMYNLFRVRINERLDYSDSLLKEEFDLPRTRIMNGKEILLHGFKILKR